LRQIKKDSWGHLRVNSFSVFNKELRQSYNNKNIDSRDSIVNIASASNIEKQIRSLISIDDLRNIGSFFTSDEIAEQAKLSFTKRITKNSIIYDPTCGTGNLLISVSKSLPVNKSLEITLDLWGEVLRGYDLVSEFVECTKLRLILEAIHRGATSKKSSLEALEKKFKYILQGDVLKKLDTLSDATHLIINPPYTLQKISNDCEWSSGKVNIAAVFMDKILKSVKPNTHYAAILPEVLRSGSSYNKWRKLITEQNIARTDVIGRFNAKTDVDVFILSGYKTKKMNKPTTVWTQEKHAHTVGDKFDVSIGPLVAYRDKKIGTKSPFIYSRMLIAWGTLEKIETTRKTKTKLIQPPFVAIKRTSSPSDKSRAVATLVLGDKAVAVENHLIVLKPKRGNVNICKQLIRTLKGEGTNVFLNQRIRCRHLTVGAVKEIPWTIKS